MSGQRVSAAHEKIIGALAGHGSASPNGNRGRVPAAIPDNASDSPESPRSPRSPRRTSPPGPAGKQWDAETPAPTQGASTPSVPVSPRGSTDSQSSDVIGSAGRSDNGLGDAGERAVVAATKLSAPAVRGQLIDRASLADRISAEPIRKLTLVSAPAGWGKTTLLAQWVHSADDSHRFGWLTLDSPDNDPVRFWTGALTAVEKAHPGVGIHALELLASGADETQVVIPTLLNELAATDKQVVLILDDYHLMRTQLSTGRWHLSSHGCRRLCDSWCPPGRTRPCRWLGSGRAASYWRSGPTTCALRPVKPPICSPRWLGWI